MFKADITSIQEIIRPKPEVEKKTMELTALKTRKRHYFNKYSMPTGRGTLWKAENQHKIDKYQLGAGCQLNQNHPCNISIMLPPLIKLGINLLQYR